MIAQYATLPITRARSAAWPMRKAAECIGLSFRNGGQGGDGIRTGDPLIARFEYESRERLSSVSFNLFFWWYSGYLCAQLSTALDGDYPIFRNYVDSSLIHGPFEPANP